VDPLKHGRRVGLVVDGVEGEHHVQRLLDLQAGGVADLEAGVGQPAASDRARAMASGARS